MEDFLSKVTPAIHARDTHELVPVPCSLKDAGALGQDTWLEAAENTVLLRLKTRRIAAGLARHHPPLTRAERVQRFTELLRLWNDGCRHAIDERLFADILARRQF